MSRRKWVDDSGNKAGQSSRPNPEDVEKYGDEEIVILLSGFNNMGDKIYNYLKMKFRDYFPMRDEMKKGGKFDPRMYGEVIAAGLGEPTAETKAEMERNYKMVTFPKPGE